MGYWASKVLPRIKKVFERSGGKKAAAAEACKGFDDSKEEINKAFEEKKIELQPKVLEIYESSSAEIKILETDQMDWHEKTMVVAGSHAGICYTLVKERTVEGIKKHAVAVNTFLEELVKIEFPGAKAASEASAKFGLDLVPGPVLFAFEKVATFLPEEELKAAEPAAPEEAPAAVPAEESSTKEREAAMEEKAAAAAADRTEEDKNAPASPAAPAPESVPETTAAEVEQAPKA